MNKTLIEHCFGIRSSGSTTPSVRLSAGIAYRVGNK
jgi:hypothetical protein